MSKIKLLREILDSFAKANKISHFAISNQSGSADVNVTVEAGQDTDAVYKEISDVIEEKISESKGTVNLSVSENVGKVTLDSVKESLGKLKFGKKGFEERQWAKNNTKKKK